MIQANFNLQVLYQRREGGFRRGFVSRVQGPSKFCCGRITEDSRYKSNEGTDFKVTTKIFFIETITDKAINLFYAEIFVVF